MKKRVLSIILVLVLVIGILPAVSLEAFAQDVSISKISAGSFISAVVKSDGTLWAWGSNSSGVLGDGKTTNRTTPVQIMSDVTDVSVGSSFIMVIKTDGTLWAWGVNTAGQLGDGTTTNRSTPVLIMSGVATVYAGDLNAMAIKTDGTLWAWGDNYSGQLGDGTTTNRSAPFKVMSGVSDVGLGVYHSLAVKTDGTLWAWGGNSTGQLGDGTTTDRKFPVKVMSGVSDVDAASSESFAVKTDGTLWAWGKNWSGELGDGTTTDRKSPVLVMSGTNSVFASAGHTIAKKTDGTLWAWGSNDRGSLGDGTTTNRTSPVQVNNNIALASTGDHTMVLKTDGTLWTWGYNHYGELGDGTTIDRSTPVQITLSRAGTGNINNFIKINKYTPNQFSDVPSSEWFVENVANAYELGLMKGNSDTYFNAAGNTSIAETVVLACRLHSMYYADGKKFTQGSPWYQVYVDYALEKGIIASEYIDYNKAATRAEFAKILGGALPSMALLGVNSVTDYVIPDVPTNAPFYSAVYTLYRAGILTGNDTDGTFTPDSNIQRSAVAAIVTRMADESLRKTISLTNNKATMYSADGRTIEVFKNEIKAYEAVGWSINRIISIKLSTESTSVFVGKTVNLYANVLPENLTDKSIVWSSSNTEVASVLNGVITGISTGSTTITATSNGVSATCNVTVSADARPILISSLSSHNVYTNSAEGVSFTLFWANNSGKSIKYVHFYATPYNKVWDEQKCDIRGYSTVDCYSTGPFPQINSTADLDKKILRDEDYWYLSSDGYMNRLNYNGTYNNAHNGTKNITIPAGQFGNVFMETYWENNWYNGDIEYVIISEVYLEYMDGSTTTLTGSDLSSCVVWTQPGFRW